MFIETKFTSVVCVCCVSITLEETHGYFVFCPTLIGVEKIISHRQVEVVVSD